MSISTQIQEISPSLDSQLPPSRSDSHQTQITNVSQAVARAIADQYPTLSALAAQYDRVDLTRQQKEDLLREIDIPNQTQKVGPSRSRKIFQLFSTSLPSTLLL